MPKPSDEIPWLAHQLDDLVAPLKESTSLEERTQLLHRMRVLIGKIDAVILLSSMTLQAPARPTDPQTSPEKSA
jgi:hypothetical protein